MMLTVSKKNDVVIHKRTYRNVGSLFLPSKRFGPFKLLTDIFLSFIKTHVYYKIKQFSLNSTVLGREKVIFIWH